MSADPWTAISRIAAREAGHATADRLRIRAELDDLAELETAAGESFAGAAYRVAYSAASLRRECWRELARSPAAALHPLAALAIIRAVLLRRRSRSGPAA